MKNLCVLLVFFVSTSLGIDNDSRRRVQYLSAITSPIERNFVTTLFRNCTHVKNYFGLEYEQMLVHEPDVSTLSMDLWLDDGKKETFKIVNVTEKLLNSSNFNSSLPIIIFIHGFMSNSNSPAPRRVSRALVKASSYNVLTLNSGSIINRLYYKSSTCVRFIGEKLGRTLAEFTKNGISSKSLHIIGHSLGAHIAGFAGKTYFQSTQEKVSRITGLDPAGPCFFLESADDRLAASDGDFVDVIHTDGGVNGLEESVGDVDFYPNRGRSQPGCAFSACSHERSWMLYEESILSPNAFPARMCSVAQLPRIGCIGIKGRRKTTLMGHGADFSARGKYYLKTNGQSPFGLGKHTSSENGEVVKEDVVI